MAVLLPTVWGMLRIVRARLVRRWRWLFPGALLLETCLWLLLAKTYSRGGLLAAVAAAGWFLFASKGSGTAGSRAASAVLRGTGVVLVLVFTGFVVRLTPAYALADASIGNRVELWRGGLEMSASAPWRGWGAGESGRVYLNWFQPLAHTENYATMVNSYLHVAVEYGLPALTLVLALLIWALLIAWRKRSRIWVAAAGASLLAWAVANGFSTLWIEPWLWVVPAAALAVIGVSVCQMEKTSLWRMCGLSLGLGLMIAGGVAATGARLGAGRKYAAIPGPGDVVIVQTKGVHGESSATWQIWPDASVFGHTPGKELRRWLLAQKPPLQLIVHPAKGAAGDSIAGRTEGVMLCGDQAARWHAGFAPEVRQVWFIHPLGAPPAIQPAAGKVNHFTRLTVFLPEIDQFGTNAAWRNWASVSGARVVQSPWVGEDIRAAWPAAATGLARVQGLTTNAR